MAKLSGKSSLPWYWQALLGMAIALPLTLLSGRYEAPRADASLLEQIDKDVLIQRLSDAFASGSQRTADRLTRLDPAERADFARAVDEIQKASHSRLYSFSPDILIETMYRRLDTETERKRFLAVLYKDAAKDSAAITVDPDFSELRDFKDEELKKPFRFSPMAAIATLENLPPLSPQAERAIGKIAEIYAGPDLGRARVILMHNLRLDHSAFEKAVISSTSTEDAIRRMVAKYSPPPSLETALGATLKDVAGSSAALSMDRDLAKVIDDLPKDLPPVLQNYTDAKDRLESRIHQQKQMKASGPRVQQRNNQAYNDYLNKTFSQSSEIKATPRTYKIAIRSARAARGVAAGGTVTTKTVTTPVRAIWMPNAQNLDFGRLIVEIADGSERSVAASRVMFADSFFAAVSVLHGEHSNQATYVDGEILVVMSMDPDSSPWLEKAYDKLPPDQKMLLLRLMSAKSAFERTMIERQANPETRAGLRAFLEIQQMFRTVVVHPALHGRELAWSAVRMDFSFNDIPLLVRESEKVNGGTGFPGSVVDISGAGVQTWQFFERDAVVRIESSGDSTRELVVTSKDSAGTSDRGHFGVSLFAISTKSAAGCDQFSSQEYSCLLEKESAAMQPLLDWLAANHHDFIRVNDFSESFTLLRWLKSANVKLSAVDIAGMLDPARSNRVVPTPNAIKLDEGPLVVSD